MTAPQERLPAPGNTVNALPPDRGLTTKGPRELAAAPGLTVQPIARSGVVLIGMSVRVPGSTGFASERPDHTEGEHRVCRTTIARPARINPGAHTRQSTPTASSLRASTNPVGPASYVARTGPGNAPANSTTRSLPPGNRRTRNSPDSH